MTYEKDAETIGSAHVTREFRAHGARMQRVNRNALRALLTQAVGYKSAITSIQMQINKRFYDNAAKDKQQ